MTDRPDKDPHDVDLPAEPTEPTKPTAADRAPAAADLETSLPDPVPSRWDSVRPRGRLGQISAILVATASAVFIAGAIFVAGFAVGSEGGEQHGHDGDGYSQSEGDDHRGGEAADGSSDETSGEVSDHESSNGGEEP
ncbi:MAG: hypothetical protein ACSLE6_19420 [Mycobacterium sp.]|jgi:hypothetical protein